MRLSHILLAGLSALAIPVDFLHAAESDVRFQAHRGGLHEVPENTMAAFYCAWGLGGIPEIDIRSTADGEIICLHDSTLERTTDATGDAAIPVEDLPLSRIQRYDAGGWFHERFSGERVPTLKQVFTVLQRHREYQVYLDLKAVDLKQLAALIEAYGVAPQIIFCHNKTSSCRALKAAIPALRTMLWVGGDAEAIWEKYKAAAKSGFQDLDQIQLHLHPVEDATWPFALPRSQLEAAVEETRAAGIDLEVLPFQFDCRSLRALVDLGIYWYATDEPLRFRNCLAPQKGPDAFSHNGVTAHRGDSGNYPENTMAAIDAAIALGVDWIEIDVFAANDGELVVTHDATTELFAKNKLAVAESTRAELQALDMAYVFRKKANLSMAQCPPATMPTLRQVIQRIQQQQRTRLSIQPKADVVDAAIGLVEELSAAAWVGFNDGDLAKVTRVKELAPEIHVFWDRFKDSPLEEDIATAKRLGFESVVPHVGALSPETVRLIKGAGLEVGAWTINDEETMKHLIDMGVERIYTDYPGRLLALKRK